MALAGDHVQVLVSGYNLTGDINAVTITDTRNMLKATAFGDVVEKSIVGRRQSKVEHTGFLNVDAARSHPVLNGVAVEDVVSVLIGQNATPTVGDISYTLAIRQQQYKTMPEINKVVSFTASFAPRGQAGGWGQALATPITITNTTNGVSVDSGAATSKGGAAILHLLQAAASDTYTIIVQGSTTGAFGGEEIALATFTKNGSVLGAERISMNGTIPRYVRYHAIRTGSAGNNVTLAVILVRF